MDALELAMKMEKDAIMFYGEAARKTKYPVGKKMFDTITEDEKRHLEMIAQIIKGLNVTPKDVSPMRNVKTVFESMKNEMLKKVEASADELEAFKVAMRMEQEGMEFYKKHCRGQERERKGPARKAYQEEQQHYAIFATLTSSSKPGRFLWEEWDRGGMM
jgi:rubrerythrin